MNCPDCQTENSRNTQYCTSCGAYLYRECLACHAQNPVDARFCNQCGTPLVQPDSFLPDQANDQSRDDAELSGEHLEERRIVTLLFADLASSTELAAAFDPEDVRALLSRFFVTMAHEIRRHGGTVENISVMR